MVDEDDVSFEDTSRAIDAALEKTFDNEKKMDKKNTMGRIRFADRIRNNPPKPGFMKVDVEPGIYSIDLNTDADWWFNRSCTVFPLLLDQAKRTHIDIKDSFKPEKRLPDFNFAFLFILIVGVIGIVLGTKMFGLW